MNSVRVYITQTIVGTNPDVECLKKKTNSQLVSGQIPRMGIHPHMKRTIRIHRTKTHTRMGTPVYETHYRTSRACLIAPSLLVYFDVQLYGGSLHVEISRVYVGLVGECSVRVFDENVLDRRPIRLKAEGRIPKTEDLRPKAGDRIPKT